MYSMIYNSFMKLSQPIKITLLILTIFNIFALGFDWYQIRPWVDIPAHIIFGILIGLLILSFNSKLKLSEGLSFVIILQVLFLGLVVGFFWEAIEYTRDFVYASPRDIAFAQQGTRDTVGDMANNIVGAGLVTFVYKFRKGKLLKSRKSKK